MFRDINIKKKGHGVGKKGCNYISRFLTSFKSRGSSGCDCGLCCSECQDRDVDSDEEIEVFWDETDWKPSTSIVDPQRFSESLKANAWPVTARAFK